jgi:acyl CoA:acetate/3-ketoacid CoA transferase alpha subunit
MDKRTTVDDIVAELQPGSVIGIGGWGSRRKPMAVVRAICRSGLRDLTVVSYGGPDVGLLCATGKASTVVCPFVTLDSIPLDPHWRRVRQRGEVRLREVDEGMFFLGLQAAAWRVPFLPTRAGLGSDVLRFDPDLRTVRSPYAEGPYADASDPEDGAAEFVAAPALRLDVAIVHANIADTNGNAALRGPDPFFDDLFLGAATRRFVTAERVVEPGGLSGDGTLARTLVHRLLTDGVAETVRGAHFTSCAPDYGRDERMQKEYAAAAADDDAWAAFRGRYVDVEEAGYLAAADEAKAASA